MRLVAVLASLVARLLLIVRLVAVLASLVARLLLIVHISTLLTLCGKGYSQPVAQLLQCTQEEQRAVIRYLWSGGVNMAEIYRKMLLHCGNNCLVQRKVCGWVG